MYARDSSIRCEKHDCRDAREIESLHESSTRVQIEGGQTETERHVHGGRHCDATIGRLGQVGLCACAPAVVWLSLLLRCVCLRGRILESHMHNLERSEIRLFLQLCMHSRQ